MSEKPGALSPDWVRCQSNSRPGRYYMLNKRTGETNWCSDAGNKITPQKPVSAKDFAKTPAQDRLKRLQSNLQKKKLNEPTTSNAKGGRLIKKVDPVQKGKTEDPKTEALAVIERVATQPIKEKRRNLRETPSKTQGSLNIIPKKLSHQSTEGEVSTESKPKSRSGVHKFIIPKKSVSKLQSNSDVERPSEPKVKPIIPNSQCSTEKTTVNRPSRDQLPVSRKLSPKSSSICISRSERKVLCSPDKLFEDKPSTAIKCTERSRKQADQPPERIVFDLNDNEQPLKEEPKQSFASKAKDIFNHLINKVRPNKPKDKEKTSVLSFNSKPSFKPKKPNNKNTLRGVLLENESGSIQKQPPSLLHKSSSPIPVPKESANARLQRLRNSLNNQTVLRSTPNTSYNSSIINPTSDSDVSSSIFSPSISTSDCEPMDWQPIFEDIAQNVISSSSLSNVQSADSSVLSEHYDTVNENLLRLAAEKRQNKQWKPDHFYFVVDTNVFLQNMTFVEELTTMKLCDTMGTLIYVPYCVLQELDKLKIRSSSESIKTRSARAIKYLNKSFDEKNQRIQAQSAADETKHLIKVTSPDDSILNCCLQVKQHVDNVVLLTEDINLQNKAMCNDVLVSTKSDLISKHESLI